MLCRWKGCLRNSRGGGMGCVYVRCVRVCVSTPTAAAEKLLFNKERKKESSTPMHVSWLTSDLYGYDWIYVKRIQCNLPEKKKTDPLHHTDSPSGIDLVHYLCNCYSSSVIKCSKPALFAVSSAIACLHLRPTCMTSNSASVGRHIQSIITKDRCVFNNVFVLLCVSVYIFSSCWFADSHNLLNARTE